MSSSASSSPPAFTAGGRTRALVIRRMAQARTMRLTVDPRDGAIRLTLPKRAALKPALAWVEEKRGWIETALAAVPAGQPIAPGATIPFEGARVTIDWAATHPRTPRLAGDRLIVGGAIESLGARVLRWLKREALARLRLETWAVAAMAGVTIGRVGVGDPKSRWGSCSSSGDIRYSWRLILAPPAVRAATVAHEVAHRLHMDHSAAFHAAELRLLGHKPVAERAWLRANGAALYGVGRG